MPSLTWEHKIIRKYEEVTFPDLCHGAWDGCYPKYSVSQTEMEFEHEASAAGGTPTTLLLPFRAQELR